MPLAYLTLSQANDHNQSNDTDLGSLIAFWPSASKSEIIRYDVYVSISTQFSWTKSLDQSGRRLVVMPLRYRKKVHVSNVGGMR